MGEEQFAILTYAPACKRTVSPKWPRRRARRQMKQDLPVKISKNYYLG